MFEQLYWSPLEDVERNVRAVSTLAGPIHTWKCPCEAKDCKGYVVYARDRNKVTGEEGFCFMATQTFRPEPKGIIVHVDNVEDLNEFLRDDRIHETDRLMYATWFAAGLREAILNA